MWLSRLSLPSVVFYITCAKLGLLETSLKSAAFKTAKTTIWNQSGARLASWHTVLHSRRCPCRLVAATLAPPYLYCNSYDPFIQYDAHFWNERVLLECTYIIESAILSLCKHKSVLHMRSLNFFPRTVLQLQRLVAEKHRPMQDWHLISGTHNSTR